MTRNENSGFDLMPTGAANSRDHPPSTKERIFHLTMLASIAVFAYFLGLVVSPVLDSGLVSTSSTSSSVSSSTSSSTTSSSKPSTPTINYYNEYTINSTYSGQYNWEHIVEPYKVTFLEVTNAVDSSSYEYIWYLDGWHIADGAKINFTFAAPTGVEQVVRVDLVSASTKKVVYTSSINVMCKYVRRELRSLVEQDRIAFLMAINIIYRVPTQTGKAIYGSNYRSKDFFTRIHLYYGGTQDCDHWHQGPGFVMTHFALSNMFEKALQAVNPALSLAYWDFTIESTFYDPTTFRDSPVFEDDWFGDAYAVDNSLHTTTSGRWAYVPTMKNAVNFSSVVNPYGMLRSPWNDDSTPYVTRSALIYGVFNNLKPSGCSEYSKGLSYRDWMGISVQLNANTHGHLHELIGGSWAADHVIDVPDADKENSGYENAYEFAHGTEINSKILWRAGYLTCPSGKTFSKTWEDYQASGEIRACTCTDEVLKMSSKEVSQLLWDLGILSSLVFSDKNGKAIDKFASKNGPYERIPSYSAAETTEIYASVMGVLCDVGHLGDMFQATSTNDVTFWVLHPTMERMWHLIQLNAQKGYFDFDETWDDTSEGICPGHFSYSVTPFKNLFDTNNIPYSNIEMYKLLHPDNLPYVYEHFNWPHCNFLDYSMTGH